MDTTLPASRTPAWRHGARMAAAGRASPAAPRRLGAAAMGAFRGPRQGRALAAARCRSLPRLAFGLI